MKESFKEAQKVDEEDEKFNEPSGEKQYDSDDEGEKMVVIEPPKPSDDMDEVEKLARQELAGLKGISNQLEEARKAAEKKENKK